ncbi:glutamate:Na+ symporter, ESS family [Hollandina sp. SP2]
MSSAMLTQLLYCFCVLSALLLLGTLLRGLVPVFRKLFLPASVIGGFIGLLIGPIIWQGGGIPFPKEWIATWSALPGILIVPVVAATPLGMKFGKSGNSTGKTSTDVIKTFGIFFAIAAVQLLVGIITRQIFVSGGMDLYAPFGYELPMGFSGGHGTAGVVGSYYKGLDLPYWEIAQGVTTTTATFGLIGGMIIGIIAINVAARTGQTAVLSKPGDIPLDMAKGYQADPAKQQSMGKETTMSSSIESLTFHLAVILGACGIAYILMNLIKYFKTPLINQIPIWAWAIVVMFGVNFCIQKIGMGNLIDSKTKSRIAGVCSDYAITAAIASLPVQAILAYIFPILVMVVVAYICTYLFLFTLFKKFFSDCYFERAISLWGCSTGVFITGLLLLKICDPEFKTPVLNDYSIGFSLTSVTSFILMPINISMLLYQTFPINLLFQGGLLVIGLVLLLSANQISRKLSSQKVEA